jgi:methyl-accepting chemotaxis protein
MSASSLMMSNEARMITPAVAELISLRQLSWNVRDYSGNECGATRTNVARNQAFTPDQARALNNNRGAVNLSWQLMGETLSRPGADAGLRRAYEDTKKASMALREKLDAIYSKLGTEGAAQDERAFTAMCNGMYDDIVGIGLSALEIARSSVQADVANARFRLIIAGVLLVLALAAAGWTALILMRRFAGPLRGLTDAVAKLGSGRYDVPVPSTGHADELGRLAEALEKLRQGALRNTELEDAARREAAEKQRRQSAIEQRISAFNVTLDGLIGDNMALAEKMQATSRDLSASADAASQRCAAVASASDQASGNVQTVATAAEELSASITEISRQVTTSAQIAGEATDQAGKTNARVQELASAAQKIGDVVKLINDIAGQTNLLALNATIEAARAGEAGKGFAVVASEVKNLATQTAKATEDIAAQVSGMQDATGETVSAIQAISGTIGKIHEIATTIASAVEEQGAATQEIARNVQQAAAGTKNVSSNIASVNQATEGTARASADVQAVVGELRQRAETLRSSVTTFFEELKRA